MTSSCSTTLFAASVPMKIVPYDPEARKRKPRPRPESKSKFQAKSMATTKTAEHSRSEVGSSKDNGGEWLRIDDDFLMLESNASLPTRYPEASHSIDHGDAFAGFRDTSELEKPEHDQFGGEPLDEGGPNHPTRVVEGDLAMIGLLGGISREPPFIVESDTAEEHYSATRVEPSNGACDCQEDDYRTPAGNDGPHAGQHGDLDAAGARAFSGDDAGSIHHDRSPAEDESRFGDVGATDGPSATRKRMRPSTMTIFPAAALDVMPESELEDTHSAKRRRSVERQAEKVIHNSVPTPKPTPLPTLSGNISHSSASTEPSLGPLDSDGKSDGTRTPRLSPSDLHDEKDGDSVHSRKTVEELLQPSRGSIVSSVGIEGEQDVNWNFDRCEMSRRVSGSNVGESIEGELSHIDEAFHKPPTKASRRRRHKDWAPKRRRGRSQTALKPRDCNTIPARAQGQVGSIQPQQNSTPGRERARSFPSETRSLETEARDETNIIDRPSLKVPYQITDLTLCAVPSGSSIVTAIVRYRDSKCSLDPTALGHKFLGGDGKVIRMTQLLPDSWMLLGYRYDDGAPGPRTHGSLNADWMSSSYSDAANDETVHLDYDSEEVGENEEEGLEKYNQRTHRPWLPSDEARLLSLKDNQGMEWKEICERFPDRSPGAVKLRYYTLHKKGLSGSRDLL